eukprot:1334409-Rhodomonas_salina.1
MSASCISDGTRRLPARTTQVTRRCSTVASAFTERPRSSQRSPRIHNSSTTTKIESGQSCPTPRPRPRAANRASPEWSYVSAAHTPTACQSHACTAGNRKAPGELCCRLFSNPPSKHTRSQEPYGTRDSYNSLTPTANNGSPPL